MARTAVVSGGGTGIGRAVAQRLAGEGCRVVLVGRRREVLEQAAAELNTELGTERDTEFGTEPDTERDTEFGTEPDIERGTEPDIERGTEFGTEPRTGSDTESPLVSTAVADLTDPEAAEQLAAELAERCARLDVLVAAAGSNVTLDARAGQLDGLTGTAWHWLENFRGNTLTAVLLVEALRPLLVDGGRIVLLSSIAAFRGSSTDSYAGAKAALHPYAFDLAAQLGPRGITVNVVAPGYVTETEIFRGRLSAERARALVAETRTGRASTPADVADAVGWLASPAAGQVTAQIVQVNGGAERGH